ncbi:hypothetical protein AB0425_34085 [Actinosynnema sp. NPDC051121]
MSGVVRADALAVEVAGVLRLVRGLRAVLVNVGHGRDEADVARATAFAEAWQDAGGQVGVVVSWPARAASWLRPACRLASGAPDAWVVAEGAAGWVGIGGRLAATAWRAPRTVAFPGLADPDLPALAGLDAVEGLRGVTTGGGDWAFLDGELRVRG